jgi:hypothetical protein
MVRTSGRGFMRLFPVRWIDPVTNSAENRTLRRVQPFEQIRRFVYRAAASALRPRGHWTLHCKYKYLGDLTFSAAGRVMRIREGC